MTTSADAEYLTRRMTKKANDMSNGIKTAERVAPKPDLIPEGLRDYVRLNIDGTLVVSRAMARDPRVLSLHSRLRKMGRAQEMRIVDPSEFQQTSSVVEMPRTQPSTTMEDAVELFSDATEKHASDVHIRVHSNHAEVLFRIHGSLQLQEKWTCTAEYADSLCRTIYGSMSDVSDSTYKPSQFQDARIGRRENLVPGLHGIRVATGPAVNGACMVLRLLYEDTEGVNGSIEERLRGLGYETHHINAIQLMSRRPSGINVVAGPTGSGKSTTLKHILEAIHRKRPDLNILTVEDPPEYPMAGIVQMPVTNADDEEARHKAFGMAIRAALRMDPDIIMIGEIRDKESARLALQAAMTGHQVWTTLHTDSAFGIVHRLAELLSGPDYPNPITMLTDSNVLSGLVFQRLTKTLCPHCKVPLKGNVERIDPGVRKRLNYVADLATQNIHLLGDGCPACSHTGISGRSAAAEIVLPDPRMLNALRAEGLNAAQQYWLHTQGGKTALGHAINKIASGVLDPQMAEEVVGPLAAERALEDGILEEGEVCELISAH